MQKIKNFLQWQFIALMLLALPNAAIAQQDSTHVNWEQYAYDSLLTFRQMTGICDSLFALHGLPDTNATDTIIAQEEDSDNTDFANYVKWRNFWQSRTNDSTGKPAYGELYAYRTAVAPDWQKCNGTSPLQTSWGSILTNGVGWHLLGPKSCVFHLCPST